MSDESDDDKRESRRDDKCCSPLAQLPHQVDEKTIHQPSTATLQTAAPVQASPADH